MNRTRGAVRLAVTRLAPLPSLSRTLLTPGPLPPHTHFGVTLLRHVVTTGLRSALHRLGLPLIDRAPVRIVGLRLYLDRDALGEALGEHPGAGEALAAMLDPAQSARATPAAARLRGAGWLHRARLLRPRRLPPPARGFDLRATFRRALSSLLPPLSDALLADLVASLERRRNRARGRPQPDCSSREAWLFSTGRPARLECLGPLDPLLPSWADDPERARAARRALSGAPPPRHRYRGRFREQYRAALDLLTPLYRALAEDATARGLLTEPSDAFFLPLDVADDLTSDRPLAWIPRAVAANRHEYMAQQSTPSPPDRIDPDGPPGPGPEAWALAPLNPLP